MRAHLRIFTTKPPVRTPTERSSSARNMPAVDLPVEDLILNVCPSATPPRLHPARCRRQGRALKDLREKNVIVYFYPAAMTPGCTKQASPATSATRSTRSRPPGYAVLGSHRDKPAKLASSRADGVTFPLLSDPDKEVLMAYGAFGERPCTGEGHRGDPVHVRGRCGGKVAVAQYNVKATGHVAKLRPRPRSLTSCGETSDRFTQCP